MLLAATPAREKHELGALLSAVSAASEGWKGVYLGPDLPASEIASAATVLGGRIVALSLLDPSLAGLFPREINDLRRLLPDRIRLVVGGAEAILSQVAGKVEGVERFPYLPGVPYNVKIAQHF